VRELRILKFKDGIICRKEALNICCNVVIRTVEIIYSIFGE
jgi:hypothetical protein